jgi:signal transduction histidine kinase
VLAGTGVLIAVWAGSTAVALVGIGLASLASILLVFHLLVSERRRHEVVERELTDQTRVLESLLESFGAIAATLEPDEILEQTRREAERLFDARAELLEPGESRAAAPAERVVLVPLRVRGDEIGALRLVRDSGFERGDLARATVLADFAAGVHENARLRAEAEVREAERARLSDQVITAEQDERRRLALFLHDTAVQSFSGIALMLDASLHAIEGGDLDQARSVIGSALERHRSTIGSLRDLSFNLEPVVLRDQGFGPAVAALVEQLGLDRGLRIDLRLHGAELLVEKAGAALYQIIRESLHAAIRREPTTISVEVSRREDGGFDATIVDDGRGERRRTTFDAIAERARTINGTIAVEQGADGGTSLHVTLPASASQR